jgi:hypothetical protein
MVWPMRGTLLMIVRQMSRRIAWSEQDFNERLASGQRRPWTQRIGARTARCPLCGRRPGECNCRPSV